MQVSRRELLACVTGLAGMSSTLGAGTLAHFTDSATASGALQADVWVERIVYATESGDLTTARFETNTKTYGIADAAVIGEGQDAFGNQYAIPFVTGASELGYITSSGATFLNTGNTSPPTQQSIVAIGSWDGSPESIFYTVDPIIYRVAPGEDQPTEVANLGNNAKAVIGVADIDEDGTDELLFVDGSAEIRYLGPEDDAGTKIQNGMGSNNQYGVGAPIETSQGPRVPVVGGSNNIILRQVDGPDTTLTQNGPAKKTAIAGRDIDGDGSPEIIFINSSGRLRYLDELTETSDPQKFYDENGEEVTDIDPAIGVL